MRDTQGSLTHKGEHYMSYCIISLVLKIVIRCCSTTFPWPSGLRMIFDRRCDIPRKMHPHHSNNVYVNF